MSRQTDDERRTETGPPTHPGGPGRPLDPELTERLRQRAATLLLERGSEGLTANMLAADTRAGKAGIYRRWPDMRALEAELVTRARVLPTEPAATTEDAVRQLAASWQSPPTRDHRVVAALLGRAVQDPAVHRALQAHVHDGLATWWAGLGGAPDAPVLHLARALLVAHCVSGPLDDGVTGTFVELALRALPADRVR